MSDDDKGEDSQTNPADEPGNSIPAPVLAAMQDRRHHFLAEHVDVERIRASLGEEGNLIYAIDDGEKYCMIGRQVGSSPDGCVYCLVARVAVEDYAELANRLLPVEDAFSNARDIELCGVYEVDGATSNIFPVQHYAHARDIPVEYLPPSPFITFTDDESGSP